MNINKIFETTYILSLQIGMQPVPFNKPSEVVASQPTARKNQGLFKGLGKPLVSCTKAVLNPCF